MLSDCNDRLEITTTTIIELNTTSIVPVISLNNSEIARSLADRDKVKQVLINLVTNACEAVSTGEAISISIEKSEYRRICISIHNGGMPIPADILPQLTKPFFTTKASGTGLGLALAEPTGGNRQTDSRSSRWGIWD
jgi:signal transduction histidine kinase